MREPTLPNHSSILRKNSFAWRKILKLKLSKVPANSMQSETLETEWNSYHVKSCACACPAWKVKIVISAKTKTLQDIGNITTCAQSTITVQKYMTSSKTTQTELLFLSVEVRKMLWLIVCCWCCAFHSHCILFCMQFNSLISVATFHFGFYKHTLKWIKHIQLCAD